MAGDLGEGGQHSGGVHALGAALAMHRNQHELAGGRRMHPGQLPGDPEPGLVEVRDLGVDEGLDDRIDRGASLGRCPC
jgi:hypothetical protein